MKPRSYPFVRPPPAVTELGLLPASGPPFSFSLWVPSVCCLCAFNATYVSNAVPEGKLGAFRSKARDNSGNPLTHPARVDFPP